MPDRPVAQKAIATALFGLQQIPIRTKCLADRAGMNMQRVFSDDRAPPNAINQLVFCDEITGRSSQNFDDLKCSCAHRHRGTPDPQFAPAKIDLARI
jgi:hypothetical protein